MEAGGEYIVTQMFFDNRRYFDYLDRCRAAGINVPIIPGLKVLSAKPQLSGIPRNFYVDIPTELSDEVLAADAGERARRGRGLGRAAGRRSCSSAACRRCTSTSCRARRRSAGCSIASGSGCAPLRRLSPPGRVFQVSRGTDLAFLAIRKWRRAGLVSPDGSPGAADARPGRRPARALHRGHRGAPRCSCCGTCVAARGAGRRPRRWRRRRPSRRGRAAPVPAPATPASRTRRSSPPRCPIRSRCRRRRRTARRSPRRWSRASC